MFQQDSISSLHFASITTATTAEDKRPPSIRRKDEGRAGGWLCVATQGRVRLAIHASSVVRMAAVVVEAPPFRQVRIGIVRLRATRDPTYC
jgi:hypothetical protein